MPYQLDLNKETCADILRRTARSASEQTYKHGNAGLGVAIGDDELSSMRTEMGRVTDVEELKSAARKYLAALGEKLRELG